MPKATSLPALAAVFSLAAELISGVGCTMPTQYQSPVLVASTSSARTAEATDAQLANLASAMADRPGTQMLPGPAGACGRDPVTVVRVVVPEQVLFATASDQPETNAIAALQAIAGRIRQQAPAAELTVLGHTDAVGSDAYNMDLSKRRADTVLHGLLALGLNPDRLTAVAIGKRQPIADNATPAGRARNRRVEFLISRCLAANLGVVTDARRNRSLLARDADATRPVEVLRVDPSGAAGLASLASITLRLPEGNAPLPATVRTPGAAQPSALSAAAGVARAAPAPHYQPRTLTPDVQRNALGAAVPF